MFWSVRLKAEQPVCGCRCHHRCSTPLERGWPRGLDTDFVGKTKFKEHLALSACNSLVRDLYNYQQKEVGTMVWARLGRVQWWPAVVIDGAQCGAKPAKPKHLWLCWFGDHKISQVFCNS